VYFDYEASTARYALYAPPTDRLFGTTIYQKGGWVVTMLRNLLGDEAFFAGLRAYLTDNAYGTGTTEAFESAMESASGKDLTGFFREWVYGVGYPTYVYSWSARPADGGGFVADVRIRQTQRGSVVYTYPLEVEATFQDGRKARQLVDVTSADRTASLPFDSEPVSIAVDPDNKVLGTVTPGN
jgi:aminopeptidase N